MYCVDLQFIYINLSPEQQQAAADAHAQRHDAHAHVHFFFFLHFVSMFFRDLIPCEMLHSNNHYFWTLLDLELVGLIT